MAAFVGDALVARLVTETPGRRHYSGDAGMDSVADSLGRHVGYRMGFDIAAAGVFVLATLLSCQELAGVKQRRDLRQDVLAWQG